MAPTAGTETEAVALDRGTPLAVGLEQRLPLDLAVGIPAVARLYEDAKDDRWDPEVDHDWPELGRDVVEAAPRAAAARVWSERAWVAFGGVAESQAALVRLCIERHRQAEAKYFLASRGREQALVAEACVAVAEACGGYASSPPSAARAVLHDDVARRALDARVSVDAFVAAHFAAAGTVAVELWAAALAAAADPVVASVVEAVLRAKRRQAAFGWAYLEATAGELAPITRRAVEANVALVVGEARRGWSCLGLVGGIDDASREAHRLAAPTGLGVATDADGAAAFDAAVAEVGQRLGRLGLAVGLADPAHEETARP
jgi:hypothetical protein